MKKIIILHRSDLFNLTSDLPIQEVEAEHFKIQIKDFNSASFIAFEEDGLLKILKNDRGACVTIPCASLLMAIEMVTKQEAIRKSFPPDMGEDYENIRLYSQFLYKNDEYFKPDGHSTVALPRDYVSFEKIGIMAQNGNRSNHPIKYELPDTPGPRFILGFDPAHKNQPDPVVGIYMKHPDDPNGPFRQVVSFGDNVSYHKEHEKFLTEAKKTAQYYGHQLLEDYNDEINSSVATAIEMGRPETPNFPETLSEAIVFFDHNFNEVPKLIFQHTEIHFTATLKISHPDIYANIKKSCGFWCQDTALYKNLSYIYKCDHEECLINTILKGIYRYRNTGRDRSGDFTDVINSYKP